MGIVKVIIYLFLTVTLFMNHFAINIPVIAPTPNDIDTIAAVIIFNSPLKNKKEMVSHYHFPFIHRILNRLNSWLISWLLGLEGSQALLRGAYNRG